MTHALAQRDALSLTGEASFQPATDCGGFSNILGLIFLFWGPILGYFRKYFEKKMLKMSVLTSFCSGKAAAGAFFSRKMAVESCQGQFFGKIVKNMEKVQKLGGKRGARSAPLC